MKGVCVPFDGATINRVLGLLDIDSDEFRQLFQNPNYNEILKKVAGPNSKWNTKKDGGLYEIPRGCLTEHAKVWFYFMSSRLLPSKHVSIVYRDRALLLYAILVNFKFSARNIIHMSLDGDLGKSLIHPSPITQPCKDAKLVIENDDERSPSMAPLPFPMEKPSEPPIT